MGLFDNVTVKMPLAPGQEAFTEFQTKSFDCLMDTYVLAADGTLWMREVKREWLPDPSAFFGGTLREVSSREVRSSFTGEAEMHALKEAPEGSPQQSGWIEYVLEFKEGLLVSWTLTKNTDPA